MEMNDARSRHAPSPLNLPKLDVAGHEVERDEPNHADVGGGVEEVAGPLPDRDALDEQMNVMDLGYQVPASTGFRNVQPRDRATRQAVGVGTKRVDAKCRDAMEKDRLAHRKGGHYRYSPPVQAVLPEPGTDSLSYVDELDRFSHNAAAAEYEQRQRAIQRKNDIIQGKADAMLSREQERWKCVEQKYEYERAKDQDLKNTEIAGRNKNSVPYNPITLKFTDGYDAQMLHYDAECIHRRAALRSNTIYSRMYSQPFNPITGEPVDVHTRVKVPAEPIRPVKPRTPEVNATYHRCDLAYGFGVAEK